MQYVCGQMSRAALYKEPVSRLPAAASCLGRHAHPAGRSPNSSSLFLPLAAVVAVAQGLFSPPDYSAGRCCSNPPLQPLFKADKTETPVPGSDTGVLGGRGWIRTTILSACPFLPCQKMQHSSHFSGTARNARCTAGMARTLKVGCKVGYFSGPGAYSDSTPETACAVASSRPVTAWEYQP